jgi:nicotinamidase-related amidase
MKLAGLLLVLACLSMSAPAEVLSLHARSQETPEGDRKMQFKLTNRVLEWEPKETAIVVCDMWDRHWCKGATRRVAEMAPRMNEVISEGRKRGVLIIHCPSGCMDFYKDTPMRKLAQQAPTVETEIPLKGWCHIDPEIEPPLPIDDSDGGCDCQPACRSSRAWERQIAAIEIVEGDAVTDSAEAFFLMKQRGIRNVIVMGVHMNMCILGRPFSIRQMIYQKQNVVLMRDLCDTMYNPRMSPFVSHFDGNRLVTQHIERHLAPTITSTDFTGRPAFKFKNDK